MESSEDSSKFPQTKIAESARWKQVTLLKFVIRSKKKAYIQIEHDEDSEAATAISVAVEKSNWESGEVRMQ